MIYNWDVYVSQHLYFETRTITFELDLDRYTIRGEQFWVNVSNIVSVYPSVTLNGGWTFAAGVPGLPSGGNLPAGQHFKDGINTVSVYTGYLGQCNWNSYSVIIDISAIALVTTADVATVDYGAGKSVTVSAANGALTNDYDPYHLEVLTVTGIKNANNHGGARGSPPSLSEP